MDFLDKAYINAQIKWNNFKEAFKNDESGVSNVVATVLLILIVVVLAAALWGFLSGWFSDIFAKINGEDTNFATDQISTGYN